MSEARANGSDGRCCFALGAAGAVARIAEFQYVLSADCEGDFDPGPGGSPGESAFELGFERQTWAVCLAQDAGDGTGVAVFAPPRDAVIGIGVEKAAFFAVLAAMVVAEEEAAVNRRRHGVFT